MNGKLSLVEQGYPDEPGGSAELSQAKDVDFWCPQSSRHAVFYALRRLNAFRICSSSSPAWLKHDVYFMYCHDGILQVDITIGDLKVGPLTLATEDQALASITPQNRFSGLPLIADLLLRPLTRGRQVVGPRLRSALKEWELMTERDRTAALESIEKGLGRRIAGLAAGILGGMDCQRTLIWRLRMRNLLMAVQSRAALRIAVRKAWQICVARLTGRDKPFGRYHRGLLIAMSGTDGVGKSSTVSELGRRLATQRMASETHYLGRGRGNLPGASALRHIAGGVSPMIAVAPHTPRVRSLMWLASWYYAAEYVLRSLPPFVQARLLGRIVVCDRYVYDIELMRNYSQTAAALARALCPTPDIHVLLTAPVDVILRRKAERSEQAIESQQATLKRIAESNPARFETLTIDTSISALSDTCAAILRHIHRNSHTSYA